MRTGGANGGFTLRQNDHSRFPEDMFSRVETAASAGNKVKVS